MPILTPSQYLPPPFWRKLWTRLLILVGYLPWVRRGYWFWDRETDTLFWNRQQCSQFGISETSAIGTYESLFNSRLWDDRDREHVRKTVEIANSTRRQFAHQFLARTPEGEKIVINARGWWLYRPDGSTWAMWGWNSRMAIHPKAQKLVEATIKLRQVIDSGECNPSQLRCMIEHHYAATR